MKNWITLQVIKRVVKIGGPFAVALFLVWAALVGAVNEFGQCGMDLTCYAKNVELPTFMGE